MSEKVFHVTLSTTLDDIPEHILCEVCGGVTKKEMIAHVVNHQGVRVETMVPGYRCQRCGSATYSHQGMIDSFSRAKEIMTRLGNSYMVKILEEGIQCSKQLLGIT